MKRGKFGEIRWDVITFIIVLFVTFIFFIGSDLKITGFDTFTTTAVPDVPTLILPNNDSRLLFNANNGFNWSGSDSEGNPMNYFLQIGNSTGFENGNLSVNITLNNANITLLSNNLSIGKYYWRVRANDSEGNSAFSVVREFYVNYAIINMTSPNNNSIITAKSTQVIQIDEVQNGDLISGVDLIFTVNGANTTYTALNTSNTSITNYTYTYSIPDVNSTSIDVVAVGHNGSNTINVTSYNKLRITRSFSESNINNPSTQFLCGYPTTLEQGVNMNISVNFTSDVLVDYVNLSVSYPNGTSLDLQSRANNFKNFNNTDFGYRYNYTFNTTILGNFSMRLEVRDINYPSSSAIVNTQSFTVNNLTSINLTSAGGDVIQIMDVCSKDIQFSGSNITGSIPAGVYDILFRNSNKRMDTILYNSNISVLTNASVCNFTDISESVSVPTTTRAIDQFELFCNSTFGYTSVNLTYNYTAILATITSESDLEFYRCESRSSCTWNQITTSSLSIDSNLFTVNVTNFSVFMISEQVTPTGGGTITSGGGSSSGGSGGTKIATLELIKPESLQFFENDTIRIPIVLKNTGSFTLKDIFLDASIDNDFFDLRFERSSIPQLAIGATYQTYLDITNNGAEPDQYEVVITSTVFSPNFKDTTKLFLNLKDKEFSKKESLLDQIEFLNELFRGNPECLEFSEIIPEVRSLIDNKNYEKANKLIENTVDGCRELISLDEAQLNFPFKSVKAKANFGLFVIESVAFLSITTILYYFYRKRKYS